MRWTNADPGRTDNRHLLSTLTQVQFDAAVAAHTLSLVHGKGGLSPNDWYGLIVDAERDGVGRGVVTGVLFGLVTGVLATALVWLVLRWLS